jgi:hypothetical protein
LAARSHELRRRHALIVGTDVHVEILRITQIPRTGFLP